MTEVAIADTAPAPVVDTAPDTGSTNAQIGTPTTPDTRASITDAPAANDFVLPDEYKDKAWAGKVKSQDDAYKQIENLTALVGKKTIAPIDYATASTEDIDTYHASLAPADISAYKFSEGADPENVKTIGEAFQKFGLNPYQAEGITSVVAEMASKQQSADRTEEGYAAAMVESFGEDYTDKVNLVNSVIKANVVSDADKAFVEGMDNKDLGFLNRLVHSISQKSEERVAAILKEHGVTETGAQLEGAKGTNSGVNIADVRSDIRNKISAMDKRQHTAQEKSDLMKKLADTYK